MLSISLCDFVDLNRCWSWNNCEKRFRHSRKWDNVWQFWQGDARSLWKIQASTWHILGNGIARWTSALMLPGLEEIGMRAARRAMLIIALGPLATFIFTFVFCLLFVSSWGPHAFSLSTRLLARVKRWCLYHTRACWSKGTFALLRKEQLEASLELYIESDWKSD